MTSIQDDMIPATKYEKGSLTVNTTTEQNKAVIRRFLEAWNSRQPESFDELIAPDVVRHCQATPGIEIRVSISSRNFYSWTRRFFPTPFKRLRFWSRRGIS